MPHFLSSPSTLQPLRLLSLLSCGLHRKTSSFPRSTTLSYCIKSRSLSLHALKKAVGELGFELNPSAVFAMLQAAPTAINCPYTIVVRGYF
jgi:hypothetical protein